MFEKWRLLPLQAGRYMKVYQELCKKHTTFRERSGEAPLG